jgi:hypothetical protein
MRRRLGSFFSSQSAKVQGEINAVGCSYYISKKYFLCAINLCQTFFSCTTDHEPSLRITFAVIFLALKMYK